MYAFLKANVRRQVYKTKRDNTHNDNVFNDDDDEVYLNVVYNKQRDTLTAFLTELESSRDTCFDTETRLWSTQTRHEMRHETLYKFF